MSITKRRKPETKKNRSIKNKENLEKAFQEAIDYPRKTITSICKKYQIARTFFYRNIKSLPNYSEYEKTQTIIEPSESESNFSNLMIKEKKIEKPPTIVNQ
jgi:hypothetical protein